MLRRQVVSNDLVQCYLNEIFHVRHSGIFILRRVLGSNIYTYIELSNNTETRRWIQDIVDTVLFVS